MNTKQLILGTLATAAMSFISASAALADDASADTARDAASTPPPSITVADAAWAEKKFTTNCEWCHGAQGHSVSPIYPALAGQKAWYIVEQLHAFRAKNRADPYARGIMWGMAAQLTDGQIVAIADYLSKQTPFYVGYRVPSFDAPSAAVIEQGKSIYNEGIAATGVAPCSACHQAGAEGSDQFPRLAGQHASYLTKQLKAFHYGSREQLVMNSIAAPLKWPEMAAVSAYLESLR
jgi:cytochrome c553